MGPWSGYSPERCGEFPTERSFVRREEVGTGRTSEAFTITLKLHCDCWLFDLKIIYLMISLREQLVLLDYSAKSNGQTKKRARERQRRRGGEGKWQKEGRTDRKRWGLNTSGWLPGRLNFPSFIEQAEFRVWNPHQNAHPLLPPKQSGDRICYQKNLINSLANQLITKCINSLNLSTHNKGSFWSSEVSRCWCTKSSLISWPTGKWRRY